jgi:hypothetical protein
MAQTLSHLGQRLPVRLIGVIVLRTAISVLLLVMLLVLGEAWAPGLIDPVLLRIGI